MTDRREHRYWQAVRAAFGRGVVVLVPVVITVWVLGILFNAVDGIISPLVDHFLRRHIPGLGFISMVVLIFVVGVLSRNLIGRTVFKWFEHLISSIPLARTIYSALKEVISALQPGKRGRSFREVVLIQYPRPGLMTIGFVTNEIVVGTDGQPMNDTLSVYLPNPPNPTSGFLVLVPRSQAQILDMSVEDGLKLVLSGGIVTSGNLRLKEEIIGKK